MVDSAIPTPKFQPFTGPRHQRIKTFAEIRKEAELHAAEFEEVRPASQPVPPEDRYSRHKR